MTQLNQGSVENDSEWESSGGRKQAKPSHANELRNQQLEGKRRKGVPGKYLYVNIHPVESPATPIRRNVFTFLADSRGGVGFGDVRN